MKTTAYFHCYSFYIRLYCIEQLCTWLFLAYYSCSWQKKMPLIRRNTSHIYIYTYVWWNRRDCANASKKIRKGAVGRRSKYIQYNAPRQKHPPSIDARRAKASRRSDKGCELRAFESIVGIGIYMSRLFFHRVYKTWQLHLPRCDTPRSWYLNQPIKESSFVSYGISPRETLWFVDDKDYCGSYAREIIWQLAWTTSGFAYAQSIGKLVCKLHRIFLMI